MSQLAPKLGRIKLKQVKPVKTGPLVPKFATANLQQCVQLYSGATPMEIVTIEKVGVRAKLVKDMAVALEIPAVRMYEILDVPKATAEKKVANDGPLTGRSGQATLGVIRLLGIANGIVAESTAKEAKGFDVYKWLGGWIERPQPSLGGRKPADLLDTPTGVDVVARLLGSISSGAYQ